MLFLKFVRVPISIFLDAINVVMVTTAVFSVSEYHNISRIRYITRRYNAYGAPSPICYFFDQYWIIFLHNEDVNERYSCALIFLRSFPKAWRKLYQHSCRIDLRRKIFSLSTHNAITTINENSFTRNFSRITSYPLNFTDNEELLRGSIGPVIFIHFFKLLTFLSDALLPIPQCLKISIMTLTCGNK